MNVIKEGLCFEFSGVSQIISYDDKKFMTASPSFLEGLKMMEVSSSLGSCPLSLHGQNDVCINQLHAVCAQSGNINVCIRLYYIHDAY